MTRSTRALLAVVVVLAAFAGGVGVGGAAPAADATATTQEDCSFPATLTDASGTEITLEEQPEEVVTLGASSAQTVWELDASERVVGMPVDQSTAGLEGSTDRTHVLDGVRVEVETVVDLDPDLVIAPGIIQQEDIDALRDAGLTVYTEESATSMDAVRNRVETTGRLLGTCEAADETVAWMDERLAIVDETTANADSQPSVFYWLGGGYTAGEGTFQGDLIERAGADNAAANMEISGWATAEPEPIVAEDPDYFLVTEGTTLPEDHPIQQTSAAQNGDLLTVDSNDWNQPAPRIVLAVENITQQLHPEAYEAATSQDESDSGASSSGGESGESGGSGESDGTSEDDSEDGGSSGLPGFGVPAAVAAMLAALGVLGRRRA